ncbi:GntR family transcriptional regulator [Antarcticimicrobium luteum]|uniref:GntR family transcriptional regulator n=1 Tax=Antarcticimicrobium luteum TaxID=2547397 RepID=A0A4R5VCS0_9RHOB|nr:GntR family transcriptional regulator [Antarcticimicrobium luteum]TDK50009.1 GntR family transcriptional regulator [Antarcticimicrobium luteum]
MTDKPSRTGATATQIAAALRTDIIAGAFAPGTVLRQEELARRFHTSRMPVRDSLRILEQEGLVILATNRGARVAPLDAAGFREISEMRAVAEPLALKHAIPELTNRQLDQAEAILDQAETAAADRFGALNKAFHLALLAPCQRPRLLSHIAGLSDLNERYLHLAARELDYAARSHAEHRALLAACRDRDAERACGLLTAHIVSASEALLAALRTAD